jgi:large subunit ribosomal protein L4
MKSPLVKGGGRAFGPIPHSYDIKVNKKVKDIAKKSALTYKAKDGNLIIVEDFNIAAPKTKDFAAFLKGLNIANTKSVVVLSGAEKNTLLSARNLATVSVTEVSSLNIYDIMNCKKLVLSEAAVKSIESNYSNN